jgi:hypothetical protein
VFRPWHGLTAFGAFGLPELTLRFFPRLYKKIFDDERLAFSDIGRSFPIFSMWLVQAGLSSRTKRALLFDHAAFRVSSSEHGLPRSGFFGRTGVGSKYRRLPERR